MAAQKIDPNNGKCDVRPLESAAMEVQMDHPLAPTRYPLAARPSQVRSARRRRGALRKNAVTRASINKKTPARKLVHDVNQLPRDDGIKHPRATSFPASCREPPASPGRRTPSPRSASCSSKCRQRPQPPCSASRPCHRTRPAAGFRSGHPAYCHTGGRAGRPAGCSADRRAGRCHAGDPPGPR